MNPPFSNRRKPSSGVPIGRNPTIVFLTACTKDRVGWLAADESHRLLHRIWTESDAWLVGNYVLMPDHLHLFAAPRDLAFTVERWASYWKSQFSKSHSHNEWKWQNGVFHHRLRTEDNYAQEWIYAKENPVRAGLAKTVEDWPYQGVIHELKW